MLATLLALPSWSIVLLLGLFLGSTVRLIHWVSFMPANRARVVTFFGVVGVFFSSPTILFALLTGFLANDAWTQDRRAAELVREEPYLGSHPDVFGSMRDLVPPAKGGEGGQRPANIPSLAWPAHGSWVGPTCRAPLTRSARTPAASTRADQGHASEASALPHPVRSPVPPVWHSAVHRPGRYRPRRCQGASPRTASCSTPAPRPPFNTATAAVESGQAFGVDEERSLALMLTRSAREPACIFRIT